ncbi:MAG: DNA mismatch repair endonuclease MutL [Caldilineaceae bacterium]|nr:DNA mismatch repair endonuclease MutL [Caldilineaceae bacterium]
MSIHLLPPDVAAKIAAGEVVERPANVAKELIENSLDADASEIRVEVRDGGQRLLRVSDNGHGIPSAEAPLAFERHATSKLNAAEDLNHIRTFGFRGEALYSIAAVSRLTLVSRHRDEPFGYQLRLEGGAAQSQGRAGAPVGTVVTVEQLFYNMPARQRFLRKAATEAGQISAVVQRFALAYPDRRFSLVIDGRLVFQSNGSGDLFDVLVKVYGLENARQMVPIGAPAGRGDEAAGEFGPDVDVDFMGPTEMPGLPVPGQGEAEAVAQVYGYTSLPSLTRANRSTIDLFVNRRYIEDRTLTHAVVQAYHTLLPVGRYPIAVVFVEVDPGQVDVNVHPQKTQVRFVEERRLYSLVQKGVRRAILRHAPIPSLEMERPPVVDPSAWAASSGWSARRAALLQPQEQPVLDLAVSHPAPRPPEPGVETPVWSPPANSPLGDAPLPSIHAPEPPAQLPPLRVVGQVGALYIIAEGPEGMFLIDQHAAHERILYERMLAQRHGDPAVGVARQQLLEPLTLHVGHEVTGRVAQHLPELEALGFAVELFGGETFLVRAVPAVLSGQDPLRVLEEMVTSLAGQRNLVGEELENRLVKLVCKRAAIKAGQLLSPLEMQELVRQLEQCRSPRTCPHGRPTMIQLSAGELEKAFGRV